MIKSLSLTSFRSHTKKSFEFKKTTLIIGKNTAGKTNILEAINFLATGNSFRAEKDIMAIQDNKDFSRINASVSENDEVTNLSIILAIKNNRLSKKFTVNSLPKSRFSFVSNFTSVLFTPLDLEIINASPNIRRKYIDNIIKKVNRKFYITEKEFEKALKQRNKMLKDIKTERKFYTDKDFAYWDNLLIKNGQEISRQRQKLVEKINNMTKEIFNFTLTYDKSEISEKRLEKYHQAERAVGQTLVGPTRDDFIFYFLKNKSTKQTQEAKVEKNGWHERGNPIERLHTSQTSEDVGRGWRSDRAHNNREIKEYGSRGEQRLTVLQLKILEIELIQKTTDAPPTLLLDDIFSELDEDNIEKIYQLINSQQTIITTTHEEFIPEKIRKRKDLEIIRL